MTDEELWRADAVEYGFNLPPPAAWPLRLWGVRHVRCAWLTCCVERWAAQWASAGIGIGGPNLYDRWVLYAIFRGWA